MSFRRLYYSHLGLHRANQENNVQKLLSEEVVAIRRLKSLVLQFHRFDDSQRRIIWFLLLRLLAPLQKTWKYCEIQKEQEFIDLQEYYLRVQLKDPQRKFTDFGSKCRLLLELYHVKCQFEVSEMFMKEKNRFISQLNSFMMDDSVKSQPKGFQEMDLRHYWYGIARCCLKVSGDEIWIAFFLLEGILLRFVNKKHSINMKHVEIYRLFLKAFEKLIIMFLPDLHHHFIRVSGGKMDPIFNEIYFSWFASLFSLHVPDTHLPRVWDILLCYPSDFVAFIALGFLDVMEEDLKTRNDVSELVPLLKNLPSAKIDDALKKASVYYNKENDRISTSQENL